MAACAPQDERLPRASATSHHNTPLDPAVPVEPPLKRLRLSESSSADASVRPPRGCSLALLPICAYQRKRLIHPVLDCSPCWATPGSEVDENGARNRQRFLSFLQQGVMAGSVTGDKGSGGIGSGPPTTGEGARHPSVSMHASTCILAHVHAHIHPHIYEHTIHSSTNAHPQERAAVYI